MAQDIDPRMAKPVATPPQFSPPTARETRAQAVHRLQVGLFGLATMLMLVGLANIIMDRAREAEKSDPAIEAVETPGPDKNPGADPLADIGVVPAADPSPVVVQPTAPPDPLTGE